MQKVKVVLYADVNKETGELQNQQALLSPVPVIRTQYNSRYHPKKQEINDEPSMTVPDMAMSINEIMKRFANGMPIDGGKVPMYEEEGDVMRSDEYKKLDLAEREEYMESVRQELIDIQKRVKERRAKVEQDNLDKIIEARVKAKMEKGGSNES